ncbi:MAG: hypothetical protein ACRD3M_10740 [Thermoanaerobaculia bacterium]
MLERRRALDVPPDIRRVRDRIAFRRQSDDPGAVLPRFNRWWDALCRQHGLDPGDGVCNEFGYHVARLVQNGLMAGDRVFVGASVSRRELAARIQDDGPGFADALEERKLSPGEGYRLDGAIAFADEIRIESRGRVYFNTPLGLRAEPRETRAGTRIFLRKSCPPSRSGH